MYKKANKIKQNSTQQHKTIRLISVFKTGAFNHSATHPYEPHLLLDAGRRKEGRGYWQGTAGIWSKGGEWDHPGFPVWTCSIACKLGTRLQLVNL